MDTGRSVQCPCIKGQKTKKTLWKTATLTILLWSAALPCTHAARTADTHHEKTVRPVEHQDEKRKGKPRARHRLRPFTPSERISADQAVAFPVDI